MATTPVDARQTARQLLKAIEQLPPTELEPFVDQMIELRARHRAPALSRKESELLAKINQGVPTDLQARYDQLIAKRRAGSLSRVDHKELLELTEQVEEIDVERVRFLAELAEVRKTTLPALMQDLGIKPRPYE